MPVYVYVAINFSELGTEGATLHVYIDHTTSLITHPTDIEILVYIGYAHDKWNIFD